MEVGVQMIFQKWGYDDAMSDSQIYDEEIRLGVLADALGFDALWPVEHHFEDYSFCPDNAQFLSFMAAKTNRIKLGTGAVILPWNQPLRVAEKIAMLDELSGGRVVFGMGRGLSRREYEVMGIDMATSRDRFDEAAAMILKALETGYVEGEGPFYPQPRARIRPKPTRSFRGRVSAVAMSPDSLEQAAKLGVRMVVFSQKPWISWSLMLIVTAPCSARTIRLSPCRRRWSAISCIATAIRHWPRSGPVATCRLI
jgi:alkanesulfonate monooxygenase SsuD/methylene tetrahydromethanopterin reductase-like flavin-dependent oxidoreductase (luciferase family)